MIAKRMIYMKYTTNLYISKAINDKQKKKIMKRVNKNKNIKNIFFLCRISESKNSLEILSSAELYKMIRRNCNLVIVGLAKGKEDSFELVRIIYDDMYSKTSQIDLDTYFNIS
jgi:RecG-like helicase